MQFASNQPKRIADATRTLFGDLGMGTDNLVTKINFPKRS